LAPSEHLVQVRDVLLTSGDAVDSPLGDGTRCSAFSRCPTRPSVDHASLLPIDDTVKALETSLPAFDASFLVDDLEAGNFLGAIGDPIAADVASARPAMRWKVLFCTWQI
jgi:hypothetical protein